MENLVLNLQTQINEYNDLLKIARKKQQSILANNIEEIEMFNQEERKILLQVSKMENYRITIINQLSQAFGSNFKELSLKEIAESSPEPFQKQFDKLHADFNEIVKELSRINDENASLIQQALKILNFTLEAVTQTDKEIGYPVKEQKISKQQSRIFDQKA